MAKGGKQSSKNNANKPLNARVSYLFNAATHLSRAQQAGSVVVENNQSAESGAAEESSVNPPGAQTNPTVTIITTTAGPLSPPSTAPLFSGTTHHLLNQLRAVSRKSQTRLSSDVKRAACKRCDVLLTPGVTCKETIENESKRGAKPWADVQVLECLRCGARKRFPIGAERQKRKGERVIRRAQKVEDHGKRGQIEEVVG